MKGPVKELKEGRYYWVPSERCVEYCTRLLEYSHGRDAGIEIVVIYGQDKGDKSRRSIHRNNWAAMHELDDVEVARILMGISPEHWE